MEQFKGTPSLKELCREMTLKCFKERDVISVEGAVETTFYIIFQGRVSVTKAVKGESGLNIQKRIIDLASG